MKAHKGLLGRIGEDVRAAQMDVTKAALAPVTIAQKALGPVMHAANAGGGVFARNVEQPVLSHTPTPIRSAIGSYGVAPAKAAVRAVGALGNLGPEVVQSQFRQDVHDISHGDISGLGRDVLDATGVGALADPRIMNQTTTGQYINSAVTGNLQTGSGWFVSQKSQVGQDQAQAARATAMVDGHALTIGRGIAGLVTEPGSQQYKTLSGLVDAGVMLETGRGPGGIGEAAKARKVLTGATQEVILDSSGKVIPAASRAVGSGISDARQYAGHSGVSFIPGRTAVNEADMQEALDAAQRADSYADEISLSNRALSRKALPGAGVAEQGRYGQKLVENARQVANSAWAHYHDLSNTHGGIEQIPSETATGEAYGAIDGIRKTILPEKAVTWLNSAQGNKFAEFAANSGDFNEIAHATGGIGKLPTALVSALVDANTPQEVKQILMGSLQTSIAPSANVLGDLVRKTPGVSQASADVAGGTANPLQQMGVSLRRVAMIHPMLQQKPGDGLDWLNPEASVKSWDTTQRLAGMPEPVISRNNKAIADALGTKNQGVVEAVAARIADQMKAHLVANGVKPVVATKVSRLYTGHLASLTKMNTDDIGNNVKFAGVHMDDQNYPLPSSHLIPEFTQRIVPIPSGRELRQATARFARVSQSVPAEFIKDGADLLTGTFMKLALATRPAILTRMQAEEQLRISASGYSSLLNHPFQAVGMILGGHDSRLAALAKKVGQKTLDADVKGKIFDQADKAFEDDGGDYAKALWPASAGYFNPDNGALAQGFANHAKGEQGYHMAWAHELKKLHMSPDSRALAEGLTEGTKSVPELMDDLKQRFWDGDLQSARNRYAQLWAADTRNAGKPNPFYVQDAAPDANGINQSANGFMDSVYDRLMTKTGQGEPNLVAAVATGKINGAPLVKGPDINPKAADTLATSYDNSGPSVAAGPIRIGEKGKHVTAGMRLKARADAAWGTAFDLLMNKPSNYLSRSLLFRQAYWERIGEMAPGMSAKTAAEAAANADAAGAADAAARIRAFGGKGQLTTDDADTLAKRHGLDTVSKILYGASKRSNFFDTYRALFPFGDAWREIGLRWLNLATSNPAVAYRGSQISNEAQQSGFLHPDPQTGKEMFTYPGSQMLTKALTGVPVPFDASASGLNMLTSSMLPGYGPAVTIPVSQLSPAIPGATHLQSLVSPYGTGDNSGGPLDQAFLGLLPAYARKLITGAGGWTPDEKRQLIGTTNDVSAYLYSTGKYDISTPQGQNKLYSDARKKASQIWLLRGLAQANLPSAPTPEMQVQDKDGHLQTLYSLAAAYRAGSTNPDGSKNPNAMQDFLNTYGDLALMATNPKTEGVFTPSSSLYDFAKANPGLVHEYPGLYGYFAPAGGAFSTADFNRQMASGERKTISPQQNMDITNQRMATAIYNQAKTEVAGRTDSAASQWLSQIHQALIQKYPQFAITSGDNGTIANQLNQLSFAVKDPQVLATESGKALASYWFYRQQALDAAQSAGYANFSSARALAGVRIWLRDIGAQLATKYPDFSPLYTNILSREMTATVADDQALAAAG